jgi:hypothetical protein
MSEPSGLASVGVTVGYSAVIPATAYTNLDGLQEVPEIGGKVDKIDVTTLADSSKRYIRGLTDPGDLAFKFLYANGATTDAFRVLKGFETSKALTAFQIGFPDGTKIAFTAYVQVSVDSIKAGAALGFTANLTINSEFTTTNPTTA